MSKSAYIVLCVLSSFILESLFQINVYILVVIQAFIFSLFWHILDQKANIVAQREQQELQVKVQSTSKDAHLKLKQLVTVVSSIPSPLLLLDEYGKVVLHNNLEGIKRNPLDEEEGATYLHNHYLSDVQEFIKDSYILEKSFERVLMIRGIEHQALSVPVMSRGKFSGCLLVFQDISKALEGEKMQKRFLADASHELKTPISVIKGMVEILNRDDFYDAETQADFLKQIQQEVTRLDELVKDILVLSKMTTNQPMLDRHKVNMQELMEGCCQSLKKTASDKNIKIQCHFACDELVFCDSMKMQQVIMNLLSNAIKYSDEGIVEVRLGKQDSFIVMEVEDHGCGLNAQQCEKIFDRFYRVNDDRARKSGGSGLGLAIVKSIVDAHSGHINVISEVGKGTTFQVFLKN